MPFNPGGDFNDCLVPGLVNDYREGLAVAAAVAVSVASLERAGVNRDAVDGLSLQVVNAFFHWCILPFKYNWLCSVFSRACNRLADKLSYIRALRLATVLYDSGRLQSAASGLVVGKIDRGFKFFNGVDPLHFPRRAGLSL